MFGTYNPINFESKWQREWQVSGLYRARESQDKPNSHGCTFALYAHARL
jgi:valyl-tRNA synthetase